MKDSRRPPPHFLIKLIIEKKKREIQLKIGPCFWTLVELHEFLFHFGSNIIFFTESDQTTYGFEIVSVDPVKFLKP